MVTLYRLECQAAIVSERSNRTTPAGRLEGNFNLDKRPAPVEMLLLLTLLPDATCGQPVCQSVRQLDSRIQAQPSPKLAQLHAYKSFATRIARILFQAALHILLGDGAT